MPWPGWRPAAGWASCSTAGARYSAAAHLTWAIDPALVQNADTMTRRYAVGGFPDCGNAMSLPASQAARAWLSGLSRATAGQQVFLTPYGDTDVAALSHVGLDPDLIRAFADRKIGQQILRLPLASDDIAWPDGGLADSSVLGNLAVNRIKTVVLASSADAAGGAAAELHPQRAGHRALGHRDAAERAARRRHDHADPALRGLGRPRRGLRHPAAIPRRDRHDRR